MSSSVQITADNAAELLDVAAKAQASGTDAAPPAPEAEPEKPAGEEKPADLEIGKQPDPKTDDKPADDKKSEEKAPESFDMDEVFNEFAAKGSLSPETNAKILSALESAGFKNAQGVIDQYIAGFQASAEITRERAFQQVGGEQTYRAMTAWAKANLSADEIASYDSAVADPNLRKLAVAGLHAQYQAATGGSQTAAPVSPRIQAGANAGPSFEPVQSLEQIARITADPRFDRDPAWRAQQEARIKASMAAGHLK